MVPISDEENLLVVVEFVVVNGAFFPAIFGPVIRRSFKFVVNVSNGHQIDEGAQREQYYWVQFYVCTESKVRCDLGARQHRKDHPLLREHIFANVDVPVQKFASKEEHEDEDEDVDAVHGVGIVPR